MASPSATRLTLLAVDDRRDHATARPAIRRYRLGRVIGDLGPSLAGRSAAGQFVKAAPPAGVRAP